MQQNGRAAIIINSRFGSICHHHDSRFEMSFAWHRHLQLEHASRRVWVVVLALICPMNIECSAQAQVVQLPSVTNFGTSGAVSVPDQGSVFLGGNRSSRTGSSTAGAGPLASRSIGNAASAGSLSVSATVIDLQAMDEALLNRAADSASTLPPNYAPRATGTPIMNTLTPHLYGQRAGRAATRAPDPNAWQIALGAPGTEAIGVANAAVSDESEIHYYMHRAQEAISTGRNAAARVYYRLAYEKLTPAQRDRLQEVQRKANEAAAEEAKKRTDASKS